MLVLLVLRPHGAAPAIAKSFEKNRLAVREAGAVEGTCFVWFILPLMSVFYLHLVQRYREIQKEIDQQARQEVLIHIPQQLIQHGAQNPPQSSKHGEEQYGQQAMPDIQKHTSNKAELFPRVHGICQNDSTGLQNKFQQISTD